MAFDQSTRNRLSKFVTDTRKLLSDEFAQQMREVFGLDPATGEVTDLDKLPTLGDSDRQTASMLRDTLDHYLASNAKRDKKTISATLDRIVREQAFTVLNRLCAVRMAEARDLVVESIAIGTTSKGFQLYARLAGTALGETGDSYVCYLLSLFDELSIDLPVLFDRYSISGRLFPRESVLIDVLSQLNHHDLDQLWGEDETIGWIYQYFNSQEERRAMRDASSAPRDSRELAVRNQFFTPRYVVEFLTDNTLGRIWYEMTQGQTSLVDECKYLVRRPDEVFSSQMTSKEQEFPSEGTVAMAELLLSGTEETFPVFDANQRQPMIDLGHCVSAYVTLGDRVHEMPNPFDSLKLDTDADEGNPSYATSIEAASSVYAGNLGGLKTQHILEVLFFTCRADRHGGDGTVFSEPWVVSACNEVRRRVLESRRNDLSQKELLCQPVFIPYRPVKDPREIKMLDPACGSMHFGLYAFDLFLRIYEEAWDIEEKQGQDAFVRPRELSSLHESYTSREAFSRDVPRLIMDRNIHGIDIDARAVQIAGLSLWLRAQKAWHSSGVKPLDRPRVTKSNIVCAEPMPGESDLLEQFITEHLSQTSEKQTIASIVRRVFDAMKLAGDAGSLLKIEEEISGTIAEAKKKWIEGPVAVQLPLFEIDRKQKSSSERPLLVAGIDDGSFWDEIEEQIYAALKNYAVEATSDGGFQRRLFAEDAARGFAFIDVCRKRYDVALMNPPFGDAPKSVEGLLKRCHLGVPNDLYCQFVQRGGEFTLPSAGKTGCITNSSFILYNDFQSYRQFLMSKHSTNIMLDLGEGVLDAYVGAAAYVYDPHRPACDTLWVADLRKVEDKATASLETVIAHNDCQLPTSCSIRPLSAYELIPAAPLCHWAPDSLWKVVANTELLDNDIVEAGVGAAPVADFFRVRWEIPLELFGFGKKWVALANAGYFATYYRDDYLVVNWEDGGRNAKADLNVRYPYLKGNVGLRVQRQEWYGKPGLVFGRRTDRFTAQPLCAGSMFSFNGISVFPSNELMRDVMLALLNSRFIAYYINLICGLHKNDVYVRRLPSPRLSEVESRTVASNTRTLLQLQRSGHATVEVSNWFVQPALADTAASSLRQRFTRWRSSDRRKEIEFITLRLANDLAFERTLGVDDALIQEIDRDQGQDAARFPEIETISRKQAVESLALAGPRFRDELAKDDDAQSSDSLRVAFALHCSPAAAAAALDRLELIDENDLKQHCCALVSWLAGVAFGRWDIRYATGEQAAPELPDAFAPLPVCPPGQFQNSKGLPAHPEDVQAAYPVKNIPWDGILVDDPNHPLDTERRVREVIEIIWSGSDSGPTAEAIEHEACEILGVRSLREYFRKPAGFFADHLSRYSKSRRQAPIYWPLSTDSGNYTIWLYYHRLTDQTLFTAVNNFVEPKQKQVNADLKALRSKTDRSKADEEELERLTDLSTELEDFPKELLRIADFWKPNLNDGVQITAAPLWKFFRLKKWRDTLKKTWEELEAGDYDWAHLALSIWPARVVRTAHKDRSIAIAHDLEELLWHEVEIAKKSKTGKVTRKMEWQPRELSEKELDGIVERVKSGKWKVESEAS